MNSLKNSLLFALIFIFSIKLFHCLVCEGVQAQIALYKMIPKEDWKFHLTINNISYKSMKSFQSSQMVNITIGNMSHRVNMSYKGDTLGMKISSNHSWLWFYAWLVSMDTIEFISEREEPSIRIALYETLHDVSFLFKYYPSST